MSSAMKTEQQRAHVDQQLSMYPGAKKQGPDGSIFVLCPYHSEKTPSFLIRCGPMARVPGYGRCFGCGQKGTWNVISQAMGLQPFEGAKPVEQYAMPKIHIGDEDEPVDDAYSLKPLPRNKKWRGISTNLLREIGCALYVSEEYGSKYLFLPVYVNGELKGFSRGRLRKVADLPSYLNSKSAWTAKYGLFPFDYTLATKEFKKSKTVVLVEGQRDALRLLALGIPALCIMGTQSWSEFKAQLLDLHGVERVVVMMDGDDAGIEATATAQHYLEPIFDVSLIKLWHIKGSPYRKYRSLSTEERKEFKHLFWDPGNCPDWVLKRLKSKYFEGA